MKIQDIAGALEQFWYRSPGIPTVQEVEIAEQRLGFRLPADYKWFLMWSDGGETTRADRHIRVYSLSNALGLQGTGTLPSTFEFATDDSDGYAFDLSLGKFTACYPILSYPLGDRTRDEVETVAVDFASFMKKVLEDQRREC